MLLMSDDVFFFVIGFELIEVYDVWWVVCLLLFWCVECLKLEMRWFFLCFGSLVFRKVIFFFSVFMYLSNGVEIWVSFWCCVNWGLGIFIMFFY